MLRILSIFGTRPEAVKMSPVVLELARTEGIESHVVVTAQHRQMLDQVLNIFDIHPERDLNLMRPNQTLAELTAEILSHLDPVVREINPDWILVQGDTTTVMAAALLAFYNHIRVGHVEAGLRTYNKWQPFPEEVNRRVAGAIADLHFAPTEHSRQNLLREGVPDWRICVTGNPDVDALHYITGLPTPTLVQELLTSRGIAPGGKRLILITAHRRENFGKPLEAICAALKDLAARYAGDVELIYPAHLNPNVQEPVHRLLQGIPNLTILDPLDYLPMIHLMKHATLVLTDSGGIQEEATSLRIPTLVMRAVTERPEGVEAGVLRLVGTDPAVIVKEASILLDDPQAYQCMSQAPNPFGDGHAAEKIVRALVGFNASHPASEDILLG